MLILAIFTTAMSSFRYKLWLGMATALQPFPYRSSDAKEIDYRCHLGGKSAENVPWDNLNDFPSLVPVGSVRNGQLKLHPGTNGACGTGDLTALGYQQHYNLGTLMQGIYGPLLGEMEPGTDLYVQSTDYRRTIRSAGAFLLGFVPNELKSRSKVEIHVQPDNVNQAPPADIPLTYKQCKTASSMREKERIQRGYYTHERELHWMYDRVVSMFNLTLSPRIPWNELFDQIAVRGCHSLNWYSVLPCVRRGVCVDCDLGKSMFDYADWSMVEKYPSNTSLVALSPFMKHSLLVPMERAISDTASVYKVMLTFTHDSMLAQLLKALGLPVKEWMPYASRLTFELWRAIEYPNYPHYLVRILFNGRQITPFWRDNYGDSILYSIFKKTWYLSVLAPMTSYVEHTAGIFVRMRHTPLR